MEIDHKVQTITYGLRLCEYFYILQMVLRHCDVGGVYHWYVEQCLELPSGHGTQRFDYNMSFIWQLSLSKTIVDSLTLKIPGRILRFSDNGSDENQNEAANLQPPPFPPSLFSWRGYSNAFPTGQTGLPKFYTNSLTIFLKESSL